MKILIAVFSITLLLATSHAGAGDAQLLRESYSSEITGLERDYYVYLPANFSNENSWPVILFLHGDGERGNAKDELDFVMMHGPLNEAWIQKRDLPFIIISPQLPIHDRGDLSYIKDRKTDDIPRRLDTGTPPRNTKFPADEPMDGKPAKAPDQYAVEGPPSGWPLHEDELLQITDHVVDKFSGDPSRLYLSGLSYGAFGVWYLASQHPEKFAAINPIVGYAHPDLVTSIAEAGLPVWCFAGGKDPVVPVEYFYAGMNKMEQLGHQSVRFTVEEDMSHDAWKRVYAGEDIYNWFLSHRTRTPRDR